jgi:hypothetical protein
MLAHHARCPRMNLTLKTKAALVTTLLVMASVSLAGGWLYR